MSTGMQWNFKPQGTIAAKRRVNAMKKPGVKAAKKDATLVKKPGPLRKKCVWCSLTHGHSCTTNRCSVRHAIGGIGSDALLERCRLLRTHYGERLRVVLERYGEEGVAELEKKLEEEKGPEVLAAVRAKIRKLPPARCVQREDTGVYQVTHYKARKLNKNARAAAAAKKAAAKKQREYDSDVTPDVSDAESCTSDVMCDLTPLGKNRTIVFDASKFTNKLEILSRICQECA